MFVYKSSETVNSAVVCRLIYPILYSFLNKFRTRDDAKCTIGVEYDNSALQAAWKLKAILFSRTLSVAVGASEVTETTSCDAAFVYIHTFVRITKATHKYCWGLFL